MDTYENDQFTEPAKKSPFADSPYECAYVEPELPETHEPKPKKTKNRRGLKAVIALLVIAACCAGTAIGVSGTWRNRIAKMEAAMDDKIAALEQLYSEKNQQQTNTQIPSEGPMTPGQVYAKNAPAVVTVSAVYRAANGTGESRGSGFIISPDGYVVTNYHVVEDATTLTVMTHDGKSLEATVKGYDASNDVALLKVEGENLPAVTLGSSDALQVGDQVAAIGNPLGELTFSLTVGYVSAKDRVVNTDGEAINMLQTDAAINAGNSGGPLFNMNGQVIGIITAKYSGNSDSGATIEGLGFAIPIDDVAGIISDLKEFGYVTGAYLGVSVRDVNQNAQEYGLPAGAYVADVTKGLAAERAGVKAGDIIVDLGGYAVDSVTTLTRVLRRFEAGQTTSLTVVRNGQKVYLDVTLDEKPVQQNPADQGGNTGNNGNSGNGGNYENPYGQWFDNWKDYLSPFFGIG